MQARWASVDNGIFGLSLVNSIFVDAMVSDNNEDLENEIRTLHTKIDKLVAMKEERVLWIYEASLSVNKAIRSISKGFFRLSGNRVVNIFFRVKA